MALVDPLLGVSLPDLDLDFLALVDSLASGIDVVRARPDSLLPPARAQAVGAAACEVQAMYMEPDRAVPWKDAKEFVQTRSGHLIARAAVLKNSQRIRLAGSCVVAPKAVVLADLLNTGFVSCGENCFLGPDSQIQPPSKMVRGQTAYLPVVLGDNVTIGANCHVEAAAVGSNVFIGNGSRLVRAGAPWSPLFPGNPPPLFRFAVVWALADSLFPSLHFLFRALEIQCSVFHCCSRRCCA
jgi:acetyltransferase-like isoleucine patch superfamily enzyme